MPALDRILLLKFHVALINIAHVVDFTIILNSKLQICSLSVCQSVGLSVR